jgi:pimeloyl-ACP methyl ester carboxylesterase
MTSPSTHDSYIQTPAGRLFARQWFSAEPTRNAPVIFFHDSLGSVELWRDFPARLVSLTGRPAVAYDRLRFGKSDPHPGKLQPDFIRDEARSGLPFVREALGIDRMILFGHSVGGGMAVTCGAAFPEETEAVITLSAQAFLEDRTVAGLELAKVIFQSEDQL